MLVITVLCFILTIFSSADALPSGLAHGRYLRSRHHHIAMRADSPDVDFLGPTSPLPLKTPRVNELIATSAAVPTPDASAQLGPSASSSAPPTSSSAPPPPPAAGSGNPKLVVAHHMVGNTYPYQVSDWLNDINLAHASGIDAFALNIGPDSWMPQRVADAYTAAQQSGTGFKLFISFDMAVNPCASPGDAQNLRTYITTYADHPNQLRYQGRVFASTFAGQDCQFGQSSVAEGWSSQFTQHPDLTGNNAVFFVPSFFVDPQTFNQFADVMDGDYNWNSGWPIQVTTQFADNVMQTSGNPTAALGTSPGTLAQFVGATTTDDQHLQGLSAMPNGGNKIYMGAVSPWFFTHYSPQTFNKNFVYLSDDHLYARRWESIISQRDSFDLVEIVTWNDYGESHYIGPIEGDQPNSQAWVDGFDHTGFLQLTKYYAAAYKTGTPPPIDNDQLVMWARPHMSTATAPDPIGPPDNFQVMTDNLWAVAMTTGPAQVTINGQSFQVQAGMTKLSVPLSPGDSMNGKISRNGQDVAVVAPQGYTFTANPQTYNYNVFVAASQ